MFKIGFYLHSVKSVSGDHSSNSAIVTLFKMDLRIQRVFLNFRMEVGKENPSQFREGEKRISSVWLLPVPEKKCY